MNLKFKVLVALTLIFAASANADANRVPLAEQRIAPNTGAIFTRDTSKPELGEAYRDPSGLIWGRATSERMNQYDADKECTARNARLPTLEEFGRLRTYLGRGSAQNYSPYMADGTTDILPGLSTNSFWSSLVNNDSGYVTHVLVGFTGKVYLYYSVHTFSYDYAVFCVSGR